LGCNVENTSTATRVSACSAAKKTKRNLPAVPRTAAPAKATALAARADDECEVGPAFVYPKDPQDQTGIGNIRQKLEELEVNFREIKSDTLHFTAFFWVASIDQEDLVEVRSVTQVGAPDTAGLSMLYPS
jgi:hypothetical protein